MSNVKWEYVSKDEFVEFINTYPRKLNRDVFGASEPPYISYNDFMLAKTWPESVVAYTYLYEDNPGDYYYQPEEKRIYAILKKLYEKVKTVAI